jgi:guanine deaminase
LWWLHTAGAAAAMGLPQVGNLQVGCEADVVVLDPMATPLLARRMARAQSVTERLFAMQILADDRTVVRADIAPA